MASTLEIPLTRW